MPHKLCRSFHPWCPGVKTRCLSLLCSGFKSRSMWWLPLCWFLLAPRWFSFPCFWSPCCPRGLILLGMPAASTFPFRAWVRSDILKWRHNGRYSVSNHQPHDCVLNRLSDADQRKHQSSASLAFVRGIHRGLVNSPHKWPVTRKMFPFDDIIMTLFLSFRVYPRYLYFEQYSRFFSPRLNSGFIFPPPILKSCIEDWSHITK